MSIKRQAVWSMAPLLVVTVINIVSVPLFYRFLGAELYALWFYVLTFTGAFGFMDLGLGVAVGRYIGVALGKGDLAAVREYWGTGNAIAIPLLALMALTFAIVGVVFGPVWFNVAPANANLLRWSFIAGGTGLFFSYYGQFWLILSQAHLDFKFLAILRTGMSLVQVIPAIPLAWATKNPLVLILWATTVTALQLAIFVLHGKRKYRLGLNIRHAGWGRAREMAVYTGKTFATLLAHSALGSADRLVLGKLAPPADFAHYTIGSNVGSRIQALSGAVMGPVFSNSSRSVGSGVRGSVAAVYDEMFAFTFPWYLLALIWSALWHPVLLRLWLGPELAASVSPIFVPVIAASCLTAISSISAAQMGPLNRVGTNLFFTILTGLLLIAGVYFGWRWYGLTGVAFGFLISRAGFLAQDFFLIRLVSAGGWLAGATWTTVATQVAIALAFGLIFLVLPRDSLWTIIPSLVHGLSVGVWLLRRPLRRAFSTLSRSLGYGFV